MIITAKKLESLGACANQVELFRHLFGERQKVTVDLCRKYAANFDWDWAAANLLSAPAWKAYEEAEATARKACQEAEATARKAYQEAKATAWKAYDEATAPVLKAYDETEAAAWKAYQEATAEAFAKAAMEAQGRNLRQRGGLK